MLVLLGQPQNLLLKSPWMSTPIRSVTMHIPITPFSGESSISGMSRCNSLPLYAFSLVFRGSSCSTGLVAFPLLFDGSGPGRTAWTPPSAFCHRSDPPAPVCPDPRRSPTSSLPAVATSLLETAPAAWERLPLGWRGLSKTNLCLNPTVGVRRWQDASALLCPHTPAQAACSGAGLPSPVHARARTFSFSGLPGLTSVPARQTPPRPLGLRSSEGVSRTSHRHPDPLCLGIQPPSLPRRD